jgi:hypothetical protein
MDFGDSAVEGARMHVCETFTPGGNEYLSEP